jgi:hypothetical protein
MPKGGWVGAAAGGGGVIEYWSLGCIVVEFFLGLPLFPGESEYNQQPCRRGRGLVLRPGGREYYHVVAGLRCGRVLPRASAIPGRIRIQSGAIPGRSWCGNLPACPRVRWVSPANPKVPRPGLSVRGERKGSHQGMLACVVELLDTPLLLPEPSLLLLNVRSSPSPLS